LALFGACTSDPEPEATPTAPSASATADAPDLAEFYSQQVRWSGCGGGFDCAQVEVPLDYANPGEATIEIEVVRLRADNPQGSLLLNPGGPGGSGVDYARAARVVVTPDVLKTYDIVGFDPRGVVSSEPIDCLDDAQLDALFAADGTPDTPEEVAEIERISAEFGAGCQARSPEIAAHMDTVSAARDIDIIRAVLGDEKLTRLGKSYGTFLGATYAELFPEKVGRLVLDGVLPSSLDSDEITLGQAIAFDEVLRRFVTDCITAEDCPLPRDVDAGMARIQQFIADLDQDPLPGVGDRILTEALGTYAILSYLYFPPTDWEVLRFGLDEAFRGDGSVLMDMMDDRTQRGSDGTFADNGNEAFYAVSCLDRPAVGDSDHAAALAEQWAAEAPVFGPYLAWGNLPCWQWPFGAGTAEAAGDPQVITAAGSDPILVVSTKYDPATPYQWGVDVAEQLDNATLLSFDGDGHTAYTSGSSCIDNAVDAYLINGTLPAEGTVCRVDGAGGGTGV
jgi:pimeloyl-ACP methyl ester carboxylesterase